MKRTIEYAIAIAAIAFVIALIVTPKTSLGRTSDDLYLYPKSDDLTATETLSAKRHSRRHKKVTDANGNRAVGVVRSIKTGAVAYVSPTYAPRFQHYVDDIEATGAEVKFMGGYRAGRCSPGHKHPCGMALDVCQLARGDVDSRCHLPGKVVMAALAMKNGLFEGALWCNGDYGHAQVGISAEACRLNLYAAVKRMKDVIIAKLTGGEDPEAKVWDYSQVAAADPIVEDKKVSVAAHVRSHRNTHTYSARSRHRHWRVRETQVAAYSIAPRDIARAGW